MIMENNIKTKIESLIKDLIPKVEEFVPESGDFATVYTEFKNTDKTRCLTDIMLKVEAVPHCIQNHLTRRYLVCVGYKIPAPYKSSCIVKAGTKADVLDKLNDPSFVTKIYETIQDINFNLLDA